MLSRSQSRALWAPLDPSAFESIAQQQQYMSLRKSLTKACAQLLALQHPQLLACKQACQAHGCTDTSCMYARGAVVFTAQSLSAGSAVNENEGITTHWKNIIELAAFHRPALLRLALTYEPNEEVLFVIYIPSSVVGHILRADAVPPIGLVGYGTAHVSELSTGLVQLCFQEVCEQLPEGVTNIDASHLTLDPTSQDKLPPAPVIQGLQAWPHGCLGNLPWESLQGLMVTSLRAEADGCGSPTVVQDEQPDAVEAAPDRVTGDEEHPADQPAGQDAAGQAGDEAGLGGDMSTLHQETGIRDAPGEGSSPEQMTIVTQIPVEDGLPADSSTVSSTAQTDAAMSLGLQRMYLQRTINRFWLAVNSMSQRLTNRVRKIRCRDGVCDGVSCKQCRGVMVFTISALEAAQHAWHYTHNGVSIDSSTPKQYVHGSWHTPSSLILKLGSMDIQLLKCATTHDRRKGYIQAVHVPFALLSGCLHMTPPAGLLFWRLVCYPDITPSLMMPLTSVTEDEAHVQDKPPPGSHQQLAGGVQSGQGLGSTATAPGPRTCSAPGCSMCEERYTGVRLLQCTGCRTAAYCCEEHQKSHWKTHRKVCAPVHA